MKRNPYMCRICGLGAELHTLREWRVDGRILSRPMCAWDIESDLDAKLVHDVLTGIKPGLDQGAQAD